MWKVLKNLVPNCGLQEFEALAGSRRGRRLVVTDMDRKAATAKQLVKFFQVHGPKLFSSLPAKSRYITKVGTEDFKMALDKWLETVQHQPKIDGLTPGTQDLSETYSNSIICQTKRGGLLTISGA